MKKLFQAVFYGVAAEHYNYEEKDYDKGLFVFFSSGFIEYTIYIPHEIAPFRVFRLSDDGNDTVLLLHGILQCFVQGKTALLKL